MRKTEEPLVKAGQGRSQEQIEYSASVVFWCGLAILAVFCGAVAVQWVRAAFMGR